jgi:hypothetical protein
MSWRSQSHISHKVFKTMPPLYDGNAARAIVFICGICGGITPSQHGGPGVIFSTSVSSASVSMLRVCFQHQASTTSRVLSTQRDGEHNGFVSADALTDPAVWLFRTSWGLSHNSQAIKSMVEQIIARWHTGPFIRKAFRGVDERQVVNVLPRLQTVATRKSIPEARSFCHRTK